MLELSRYGLINCFTLRRLNPPTKWFSFFILTSLCCCSLVFFLLETTNISSPCLLILLLRLYLPLWYLCHFFNLLCSWWCSESLVSKTTVLLSNFNDERLFTLKISESETSLSWSPTTGSSWKVFLLLLLATSSESLDSLQLQQLPRLFTC